MKRLVKMCKLGPYDGKNKTTDIAKSENGFVETQIYNTEIYIK